VAGVRIQATVAAFLAAVVALHPVLSPDLWWHLASGRWILEHHAVPRTDVLTYTMTGSEWVNLQWLTDVALVTLWRWAGPGALVLAKAACLAATAGILVATCRAAGSGAAAAGAATILAVLAGAERTMVRPEILTGLALASVLWIVARARDGHRLPLLLLPPLVLVWANLHALAFLGPLTVLLHAGLAFVDRRLPEAWRDRPVPPRAARDLLLAGVASAVALLGNPWGWKAWTFPLTLLERIRGDVDVFSRILEFARPLDAPGDPALRFAWILAAALALSFLATARRFAPTRLLAVLPFIALALLARRNVPLFALAAAPVLATNLERLRERLPRIPRPVGWIVPAAGVALAVTVLAGASPRLLGLYRDRGLFVAPGLFPERSLAVLDRSGVDGPLFNDLDFGGFLVWRDPARGSFIDGRLEVAGPDRLASFIEAHEDPAAWERLLATWDFRALLLDHSSRGNAAFLLALLRDGRWSLLDASPEAVVLVADGWAPPPPTAPRPAPEDWDAVLAADRGPEPGAGHALAPVLEPLHRLVSPHPPAAAVRSAVRWANLCVTLGWLGEARTGYGKVLEVAPNDPETWFQLGVCDYRQGRRDRARERWEQALRLPGIDRQSREIIRDALDELTRR